MAGRTRGDDLPIYQCPVQQHPTYLIYLSNSEREKSSLRSHHAVYNNVE